MNKLTKAGIATGAAVALLMGGAGTLAYWNSEANLGAGDDINAGNLTVAAAAAPGVWTVDGATIDIATYKIVPGDELVYSKTVDVHVDGDNLTALLTLAPNSIVAASGDDEDEALAALLSESATFAITAVGADTSVPGQVTFTASDDYTVSVSVTVEFPNGAPAADADGADNNPATTGDNIPVGDNEAKLGSVSLSDFSVLLTQVVS